MTQKAPYVKERFEKSYYGLGGTFPAAQFVYLHAPGLTHAMQIAVPFQTSRKTTSRQ